MLRTLLCLLFLAWLPPSSFAAPLQSNDASRFCCVNGTIRKMAPDECGKHGGIFYKSEADAKQRCQPVYIYCCISAKIIKTSQQQCTQERGTAYKSMPEATRYCRSLAPHPREKPSTVSQTTLPDLSISRFSSSPSRITSGDTTNLSVYIKNDGNQPLQRVLIKFHDINTRKLLGKNSVSLAAKTGKKVTVTVPLTGTGRLNLMATVDPDHQIKERNENNNTIKTVIIFTKPLPSRLASPANLPDLIPIQLKLDGDNVAVNESISLYARIRSSDRNGRIREIPVAFLVDGSVIDTKTVKISGMGLLSVRFEYYAKRAGQHILSIKIDPNNLIAERNEGNNRRTIQVEVLPRQTSRAVPGQIIFLVDSNSQGRSRLNEITKKYDLQIVRKSVLSTLQRLMVVCSTDGTVQNISTRLEKEWGVYGPQPNFIFSTLSDSATTADPLRSMQSINSLLDLDSIHKKASGKNVLIAIIDTGIDLQHQDLRNRIKEHKNFIEGSTYRAEIHGTAVAGIIAAARNNFGIIGIAPDAKILAYRACRQPDPLQPEGQCYSSSIAEAIDTAIVAKAQIANLSLGSEQKDPLLSTLINEGNRRGLQFVAPVGNNSTSNAIRFPASHPAVTAVAGFDERNGPIPNKHLRESADATAPSEHIFSSIPQNHHNYFNGTSFSAATITGLMALSLEKKTGNISRKLPSSNTASLWKDQFSAYIDL